MEIIGYVAVFLALAWLVGSLDRVFPVLFRKYKPKPVKRPAEIPEKLRFRPVEEESEAARVYRHQKALAQTRLEDSRK